MGHLSYRVLPLLALLACAARSPTEPCAVDCGAHGSCGIVAGHAQCLCATGFVSSTSGCVAAPCPAGQQDNDHDGTCRPACPTGPQPCDDSSGEALLVGTRSCDSLITYRPTQPTTQVFLRGEMNGWSLDAPMVLADDGSFSSTLRLPPGSYGYKLYDAGRDAWFEDPKNPYFRWVAGQRNSRLIVPDCNQPLLRLVGPPAGGRFAVQYVDGAGGAGLGSITVTRDGAPVSVTPGAILRIDGSGLAPGKYLYRIEAADAAGRAARPLVVPVWLEDAPFDWRDAVLYFALTDRFLDGDPANDAPVAGVDPKLDWHGGDFAGIRAKIEDGYFDALGVNALWVSSISQNTAGAWPGDDGRQVTGYHSYWPISTGWRADAPLPGVLPVDPHFGSLDDFKALVAAAHRRGIRVLVDLVANHVHSDSPLWAAHRDWFNLPETDCVPTNYAQPVTCWFTPYLPDLRYEDEDAIDLITEHGVWLVEETGIDGFRLDAVKHMIDDFPLALRARLGERVGPVYLVGETFTGEDGAPLLQHYLGPLDGQFDFPLYWQIVETLLREERDLGALSRMVAGNDRRYGDAIMSTFMGNHDVCRALSHAAGAFSDMWCTDGKAQGWSAPPPLPTDEEPFRRLRLAWTFLLTSPGVPLIYYGDEIGMEGAGDPDNRKPMRFGGALSPLEADTLAAVKKLGQLRRAHPALRRGTRRELALGADGLFWAYAMELDGDRVVVAINRSPTTRTESLDGSYVDALTGAAVSGAITLPGHTAAVLVKP